MRGEKTLWTYNYSQPSELAHHGILGQKWGKRNGPPYPLGQSDKSAAEKRAEKRQLTKKQKDDTVKDKESKKFHLTDKQKTAIKIGAAVAGTALVAIGGYQLYKSGKLDGVIEVGRNVVDGLLSSQSQKSGSVPDGLPKLEKAESLSDTLKNVNPRLGTTGGRDNCTYCGLAGAMRQAGYDVVAKGSTEPRNLGGILEECFKGVKVMDGSATKFGRSKEDAAEMLLKRYGQNASGVCSIQWKGEGNGGHTFSWSIKDGIVSFFDCQQNSANVDGYFSNIDTTGSLTLARLDGLEIDLEAASKYVEAR